MAICHYWFAKLLTSGQKLANDGTLLSEPNPEKAKFHFEKAIQIDPSFDKAYYRLGLLLYDAMEYKNAYEKFVKAIKLNASFARAHYSLAVLLMNKDAVKVIDLKSTNSGRRKK